MATNSRDNAVELLCEVSYIVGQHKVRYLEQLAIAGLSTDPHLLLTAVFRDLTKSSLLANHS